LKTGPTVLPGHRGSARLVVIWVNVMQILGRMVGNQRECWVAMPVREPLSSLQPICPRRPVRLKHETPFVLLLRFTNLSQSNPPLERFSQAMNGRFPGFAPISSISP
jgi:hypothetical protein